MFQTITAKIGGTIVGLLLLLIPATNGISIWRQSQALEANLISKGQALTTTVARSSRNAVLASDFQFLHSIVRDVIEDEDVAYAMLMDSEGEIKVHSQQDKLNTTPTDERSSNALASTKPMLQQGPFTLDDRDLVEFSAPIMLGDEKVFTFRLAISMARSAQSKQEAIQYTIYQTLGVLAIGFLGSILLSRMLSSPIKQLKDDATLITEGNLESPVSIPKSKDEVGSLARAFEEMRQSLKKRMEQLREYSETLEEKVEERTRELRESYEQVNTMQDQLMEASKLAAVGEIAGRVAHEVLNPITAILVRVERNANRMKVGEDSDLILAKEILMDWKDVLDEGGSGSEAAEHLAEFLAEPIPDDPDETYGSEDVATLRAILRKAERMQSDAAKDFGFVQDNLLRVVKIVDNLRGLSRRDKSVEIIDITESVDASSDMMYDGLQKRDVDIITEYADVRADVRADPGELIQVFTNLIRNGMQAIEETGESGGEIRLTTNRGEQYVRVDVTDTGIGMTPDVVEQIFEANFTTKDREQGTGLGLSISRRIIRDYGGDIVVVESTPGEGTTFRVTLPRADKADSLQPDEGEQPSDDWSEDILTENASVATE